jgi:hypothetical protein
MAEAPDGHGGAIVLDQPWQIELARLAALRGRLKLEITGITFSGRSSLTILRSQGITAARTRVRALADLEAHIGQKKAEAGMVCTICYQDPPSQGVMSENGRKLLIVCDSDICLTNAQEAARHLWG